jgi:hypothetical protein
MASTREYRKLRQHSFRDRGLCISCGKKSAAIAKRCEECHRWRMNWQKQRRDSYLAEGMCSACGKRKLHTKTMCKPCSVKHAGYVRTRRQRCKASNLCTQCGKANKTHTERCAPCMVIQGAYREKVKGEVYAAYGGYVCACCGEDEPRFLTIDHIQNDGNKMRGTVHPRHTWSFYLWIRRNNFPTGLQVLCWNCQQGKHFNGGVCPHKCPKRTKSATT